MGSYVVVYRSFLTTWGFEEYIYIRSNISLLFHLSSVRPDLGDCYEYSGGLDSRKGERGRERETGL